MRHLNTAFLPLLIAAVLMLQSCEFFQADEFTEQDLFDLQQTVDLNIVVQDASGTQDDLSGVTVSIVDAGSTLTDSTNSSGLVTFSGVKSGNKPLSISHANFTNVDGVVTVQPNTNFANSEQTFTVPIISTSPELNATISGNARVDIDLTNTSREQLPAGTAFMTMIPNINLPGGLQYSLSSFTAEVSVDGTYTLELPATQTGINYTVSFFDINLDQTLAINRLSDEPAFPETEPSITTIKTSFGSGNAGGIPNVTGVYAKVSSSPSSSGSPAVLGNIFVNANGEITSINIINGGSGYEPDRNEIGVDVVGLSGGSGASVLAQSNANGNISGIVINNGGSGYRTNNVNTRGTRAFSSDFGPGLNPTINIRTGSEYIRNIDFGTGRVRAEEIQ